MNIYHSRSLAEYRTRKALASLHELKLWFFSLSTIAIASTALFFFFIACVMLLWMAAGMFIDAHRSQLELYHPPLEYHRI